MFIPVEALGAVASGRLAQEVLRLRVLGLDNLDQNARTARLGRGEVIAIGLRACA
jgi:hypothetical protein